MALFSWAERVLHAGFARADEAEFGAVAQELAFPIILDAVEQRLDGGLILLYGVVSENGK